MNGRNKTDKYSIELFISDLDGTLLGEHDSTQQFKLIWENLEANQRPFLCYNTGRGFEHTDQLVYGGVIPKPDYLICSVGTEIHNYPAGRRLIEFNEILSSGWDRDLVDKLICEIPLNIQKQPAQYQNNYKSSWYFDNADSAQINEIRKILGEAGLNVHVVYSSARHLDILPKWANKGNALQWLLEHLDIPVQNALVAGDSGNDRAMFSLNGIRGIVVGNAQPELIQATQRETIYHAPLDEICAQAVISGLKYFGVLDEGIELAPPSKEKEILYESLSASGDIALDALTTEQLEFIRHGYHTAIQVLKSSITTRGFASNAILDNLDNQKQVRKRDLQTAQIIATQACMTIKASLSLTSEDEQLHDCQRRTLETLIELISPSGQVPSAVNVNDGSPVYAGALGTASVDSGLWLIIATYAYTNETHNYGFLRTHFDRLQQAMNWLSAHDSNNDGFLEIPEGGDWTGLMGRRYNVLYDEVLWYRSNICFGRLLQMLGDEARAGDYLRWAHLIRSQILGQFWPSTHQHIYHAINSSLKETYMFGDASYLIAQLTPYEYDWRCDIFANILAYQEGLINAERASQMFRFMWGVGVNSPFPVANLYPVAPINQNENFSSEYFHLMFLPHHAYNGGIWPAIGGQWVRFINKLGLRDVALQELYKLADLNKMGVLNEWEFNEWAHGETGRPMGRAYQAWSAAEYVRACHEVHVIA